jgi:hypothetical protein
MSPRLFSGLLPFLKSLSRVAPSSQDFASFFELCAWSFGQSWAVLKDRRMCARCCVRRENHPAVHLLAELPCFVVAEKSEGDAPLPACAKRCDFRSDQLDARVQRPVRTALMTPFRLLQTNDYATARLDRIRRLLTWVFPRENGYYLRLFTWRISPLERPQRPS